MDKQSTSLWNFRIKKNLLRAYRNKKYSTGMGDQNDFRPLKKERKKENKQKFLTNKSGAMLS